MTNTGRSRFVASQGNVPVVLYPSDQFPTIASIPTGAVVYDTTDGVVKRKVGDYLVDIQYNVIGYGPIADAPVASAYPNGVYFLDNSVTPSILYVNTNSKWVIIGNWLMYNGEQVLYNGQGINVDDMNSVVIGESGFALGGLNFIIGGMKCL